MKVLINPWFMLEKIFLRKFWTIFLFLLAFTTVKSGCGSRSQRTHQALKEAKSSSRTSLFYDSGFDKPFVNKYQIHFINVGQGESILILTPDKTVLIDAGERNSIAANYLTRQNINHIDIAIATHPHADHIGGFLEIFELFTIGELIDPGVVHTTLTFEHYLTQIYELDIPFTIGRKGMRRELGANAFLEILHPEEPSDQNLNAASLVVKLTLENISALFTGDIERQSEIELLKEKFKLQSNILKVPHHGSATSSHNDFLNAVKPEIAVISSNQNSYGFPDQEVLRRLKKVNSKIFRTDIVGHIIVSSDGQNFFVDTFTDNQLYEFESAH